MKKLAILFFEFLRISLFVIGGGYAIVSVADRVFSEKGWTKEGELLDSLPLFQMIPGILAGHCAVYVGNKVFGRIGAVVALAGVVLPSFAVFSFVARGYSLIPVGNPLLIAAFTGLRSALAGIVIAMLVKSWRRNVKGAYGICALTVATALVFVPRMPVAAIIAAAMAIGVCRAARPADGKTFRTPAWLTFPLFLKYGIMAFGGGYVLVPMYLRDFVGEAACYLQLPPTEFGNMVALTQMTPGPIGINAATFFGFRLGGVVGSLLATVALILPGFLLLEFFLSSEKIRSNRFVCGALDAVRPVTVALMIGAAAAFLEMSVLSASGMFCAVSALLVVSVGMLTYFRKAGPVTLIVCSALASVAVGVLLQ